jgi:hypothetical protein
MNCLARRVLLVVICLESFILPAWPWGKEGHSAINHVAAEKLPPDVPAFLRNAADQLAYIAPEPDRWRETSELALKRSQEPDHFIDLDAIAGMELPRDRYSFIQALEVRREETPGHPEALLPDRVGMQPYITIEVYERLVVAFREYRRALLEGSNFSFPEADAIFYAGWLGHYVGDGANPLHTSENYNGWTQLNPRGYTTSNTMHWKMEGVFVASNLKQLGFAELISPQPRRLTDPFHDYMQYLYDSHKYVEAAYQLEKQGGFNGEGSAASRDFIRHRLAAGATMLRDMWYSAWLQSAQDVDTKAAARPETPSTTHQPASAH